MHLQLNAQNRMLKQKVLNFREEINNSNDTGGGGNRNGNDDLELLHNVQIWIDENQNRQYIQGHGFSLNEGNNISFNNNKSVFTQNVSFIQNQNKNNLSGNFFESDINSDNGNQNRNLFLIRKASINQGTQNQSGNKNNKIISDHNNQQERMLAQDSDRYQLKETNKKDQEQVENDVIKKKQQLFQKQIQSTSDSQKDSLLSFKRISGDNYQNLQYPDNISTTHQNSLNNQPQIIKRLTTNQKANIFIKNKPLKPLQSKNYYLLKRFDAAMIFSQLNENNIYNIDYNIHDLQLVGNQFRSKQSPLPQNYPNISPIDKKFMNKYSHNNSKQVISDHKELLQFLKQKYQEQQEFILQQDNSYIINQNYSNEVKQKHFDINNFDKYTNNSHSSKIEQQQRSIKKIQNLDQSLSNEKYQNPLILQDKSIQAPKSEINKHRKFLSAVSKQSTHISQTPLKKGNNSELVKRCLDERNGDWQEITSTNTLFNFKWVPFSKGIRFDYLTTHGQKKMVNHFEGQDQISQKDTLFINLQKFCESHKENVFEILPITFIINLNNKTNFTDLERFYLYFATLEKNKKEKEINITQINNQILNHALFIPVKHSQSTKYQITQEMFDGQNFWLIKPPDFNRGRGVQVFNSIEQFKKLMNDYQQGIEINLGQSDKTGNNQANNGAPRQVNSDLSNNAENKTVSNIPPEQILKNFTNLENVPNVVKTNQLVIQKYLEKPLLIKKRKFDIRLWVLVGHDQKCYLFKEGYIRTSSQEFELTPSSIEKPFIHLTNNAVQRYNENYGAFEEGNQLSFKQAQQLIEEDGDECDFYQIIKNQIEEIIVKSLKSVENKLNNFNRKFCMEIFGYDFILDINKKPWLIEVNTNPCLEESSNLLKFLIPRMIDDSLKLTVDQIFPPKKQRLQKFKSPSDFTPANNIESQEDNYQSIQLASEPGVGSQNGGPVIIHQKHSTQNTQSFEQEESKLNRKDQLNNQTDYSKSLDSNQQQSSKLSKSKYHVEGYSDFENLWQLIYQLKL